LAKVKTGKSGGKQSLTRHPLFPATVALWFGALFGVGSLAIRPSLIEGLIVSSGIDLIIPAAAPPMGVTTRILIALALAALGGTLGAWLARRLSQPKSVAVPRKRGAPSAGAKGAPRSQSAQAGGARRSRLALSEEGRPRREYVDHAPLPGQANILDVSQFDLDGFEAEEPDRIEAIGASEAIEAIHEDLPPPIAEAPLQQAKRRPGGFPKARRSSSRPRANFNPPKKRRICTAKLRPSRPTDLLAKPPRSSSATLRRHSPHPPTGTP